MFAVQVATDADVDDGEAVALLTAYTATAGATRQPIGYTVLRSMCVAASHRRAGDLYESFGSGAHSLNRVLPLRP